MMKWILLLAVFPFFNAGAQSALDRRIEEAVKSLTCVEADEGNPVTMNAVLIQVKDSMAVILKVKLAPGWHIYDFVPASLPYISNEYILSIPKSVSRVGEWIKSKATGSSADPGVLMYEDEALLIHKLFKTAGLKTNEVIKAGLYYQTCNLYQCLPPIEKTFELKITEDR